MMNNEILKYKGCLPDLKDERDYNAEELMGDISNVKIPSFKEGYSVRRKYWSDMTAKDQKFTFSCVGQAWAYYKQILQFLDTGEKTELSAKSIYNPIAIPGKGSRIRDGGLRTVSYGVNKESSVYSDHKEEDITAPFNFSIELQEEATFYKNQIIASVNTQNFDTLARMIVINNGVVSGWAAHAVWFDEYGMLNGKRFLRTINSYGPAQELTYYEGDKLPLFSIWTAIDIRNMPKPKGKLRLIRAKGEKTVWYLLNGRRYWVHDPQMMSDGLVEGVWEGFSNVEELSKEEVYSYPKFSTSLGELWKIYISK